MRPGARSEAKRKGATRYFTGVPCIHGHVAERQTSNGECLQCVELRSQTDLSIARQRERVRKYQASIKYKIRQAIYLSDGRRKKYAQTYNATANGKAAVLSAAARRRAKKRNAGGEFTKDDLVELLKRQKICHICKKRFTKHNPPTIDHIVALASGGSHDRTNIALAHTSCNIKKNSHRTHLI